jgi:signal transduction histidine kinase
MFRFHRRLIYWNIVILAIVILVLGGTPGRIAVALSLGIFLTLLVSQTLKLRVAVPLADLSSTIRQLTEGDFEQRLPLRGDEDIAELLRSVNAMSRSFGALQQNLRERLQKAESFLQRWAKAS